MVRVLGGQHEANDLHENGGLDRDQAEAKAQADFASLVQRS